MFVFCRIAVYKAIFPSVGTLADVIAAIDQVSVTSILKLIKSSQIIREYYHHFSVE